MDFKLKVAAIAATHGCSDVLDINYSPDTLHTKLFEEQQIFMFSVFTDKLKTLKSKLILGCHFNSRDAQDVWYDLCKEYKKGMTGKLLCDDLEERWKSFKCDNRWTRLYEAFLHSWQNRLSEYERSKPGSLDDDKQK